LRKKSEREEKKSSGGVGGANYGIATEPGIGVYAESSLHASLKLFLAEPGDSFEVKVRGKVADILKASGEIVEIQTGAFAKLKPKMAAFSPHHPVKVVYPIAKERIIITLDPDTGDELSRRKSPKRGKVEDIFNELVHFPELLAYPGLSLEIVFVTLEEIRVRDGQGSWRRRGVSIHDRRLIGVTERQSLDRPRDILKLLPGPLPEEFTSADIARVSGKTSRFGGVVAYVLSRAGLSEPIGKRGRSFLYRLKDRPAAKRRGKPGKKP